MGQSKVCGLRKINKKNSKKGLTFNLFSAIIKPSRGDNLKRKEATKMMDWMQDTYEEYMEMLEEAGMEQVLEWMEELEARR